MVKREMGRDWGGEREGRGKRVEEKERAEERKKGVKKNGKGEEKRRKDGDQKRGKRSVVTIGNKREEEND